MHQAWQFLWYSLDQKHKNIDDLESFTVSELAWDDESNQKIMGVVVASMSTAAQQIKKVQK